MSNREDITEKVSLSRDLKEVKEKEGKRVIDSCWQGGDKYSRQWEL